MTATSIRVQAEIGSRERIDVQAANHVLVLDQPEENRGDGFGPTPVELFIASIAACTAHYLRRGCRRHGVDPTGLVVEATADPSTDSPARIGFIRLACRLPIELDVDVRKRLIRAAKACYVARSLSNLPEITIELQCGAAPVV